MVASLVWWVIVALEEPGLTGERYRQRPDLKIALVGRFSLTAWPEQVFQ